ncbi:(3S,6E)-nerolidol synthase [Trifolium repens]|nr:(3S,6E)-nerolidol synthase [Trifolium repens]
MWPKACFTDPSFSEERIELTKVISLIYLVDDIFDVHHGTLGQLTLFTDLATRWTLTGAEELPDFMEIYTLKKSWIRYLNSVLKEAHWLKILVTCQRQMST